MKAQFFVSAQLLQLASTPVTRPESMRSTHQQKLVEMNAPGIIFHE